MNLVSIEQNLFNKCDDLLPLITEFLDSASLVNLHNICKSWNIYKSWFIKFGTFMKSWNMFKFGNF